MLGSRSRLSYKLLLICLLIIISLYSLSNILNLTGNNERSKSIEPSLLPIQYEVLTHESGRDSLLETHSEMASNTTTDSTTRITTIYNRRDDQQFNLNPRRNLEASAICANVRQEKCTELSSTELAKLREQAREGLDTKFALLSLSAEEAQLKNSYHM